MLTTIIYMTGSSGETPKSSSALMESASKKKKCDPSRDEEQTALQSVGIDGKVTPPKEHEKQDSFSLDKYDKEHPAEKLM